MRIRLNVKNNIASKYVYICEEIEHEEDVQIDCPMCDGRGEYEAYDCDEDRYFDICCPCCRGDGEVTTTVYYNEYIEDEVEVESEIYTYSEGCVCEDILRIHDDELYEAKENLKENDILTRLVKGEE